MFRLAPLVAVGLTSGCISLGGRNTNEPSTVRPTRTQLLMLNRAESSGWVGYTDQAMVNPPTEDYRILVIRQSSGEVLYDSVVPLPQGLRTHGFEMEQGDPRLQNLARQVDRNIIDPMEAYQREIGAAPVAPPPSTPPPDPSPETKEEMAPEPEPATSKPEPPAKPKEVPALVEGPNSSLSGITVLESKGKTLKLDVEPVDMLKKGDRLYLRLPPKVIVLPGMDNNILTPGEISGLVEVTDSEDGSVTAKLLSGEVPAEMYFERAENP